MRKRTLWISITVLCFLAVTIIANWIRQEPPCSDAGNYHLRIKFSGNKWDDPSYLITIDKDREILAFSNNGSSRCFESGLQIVDAGSGVVPEMDIIILKTLARAMIPGQPKILVLGDHRVEIELDGKIYDYNARQVVSDDIIPEFRPFVEKIMELSPITIDRTFFRLKD